MDFYRPKYLIVTTSLLIMTILHGVAYDPLDPYGRIEIKWDVVSWTPDGYVAVVTMTNFQMYRHIMSPGWTLGWTWPKKEIIWSIVGAEATDQEDCSQFKGNIPHCCMKNPTIIDLLPGVPKNQMFTDCCKAGILASWGQYPAAAVSSFQVSVSRSGISNTTVKPPEDFYLLGPGSGYPCSGATIELPSVFYSSDGRRKTKAMTCSCGCQNQNNCVRSDPKIASVVDLSTPSIQCTEHMCPIRVHWHVKANYKEYWLVKITITNFNYQMNYTRWTLVAQHPNLNNITQVYKFDYKPLLLYNPFNDTGMFYGVKYYNDLLMEAGPDGNFQSDVLLGKDKNTFTLEHGWAFPSKIYFNGDECKMPLPDSYPFLPNSAHLSPVSLSALMFSWLLLLQVFWFLFW